MNAEELMFDKYSYLVPITLYKLFPNPEKVANSYALSKDDLLQYGRIGLLDGIRNYQEKGNNLNERSFMIRNIRWSIGRHIQREALNQSIYKNTYNKKKHLNKRVNLLSMNQKPYGDDDDKTFHDIVPKIEESVEDVVSSSMEYNKLLNVLNEKEKDIVLLKMKGLTYQEIGQQYGISKQRIGQFFKVIQDKINIYLGVAV